MNDYLNLVWYDAKKNEIFQSAFFEAMFCSLSIHLGFWSENPHIELVGTL